jgi:superfamily I DNA and/or RNA helicase
MHPEIALFAREVIYEGKALKDANTIEIRDEKLGWSFGPFRARRMWANVDGREQGGVNQDEIRAMAAVLRDFIAWARRKGPPARDLPRPWEVACLCFYVKQAQAISDMLREVTQDDRKTRFQVRDASVEVVCGTVDRFQGREADLVMLSMRNTRRVGFLDSPNRLNVAVTRARQQLVVFGKSDYFGACGISELEALARRTPLVEERAGHRWRRSSR